MNYAFKDACDTIDDGQTNDKDFKWNLMRKFAV